jgi:hypothetical protein
VRWRAKNRANWHRWFAWYPVSIDGQLVWLEIVERRCGETFCGDYKEYRA